LVDFKKKYKKKIKKIKKKKFKKMNLFTDKEVQLHSRNHGCPIESIKSDLTPEGLHYTLIHV
jgi:hypothetical protein